MRNTSSNRTGRKYSKRKTPSSKSKRQKGLLYAVKMISRDIYKSINFSHLARLTSNRIVLFASMGFLGILIVVATTIFFTHKNAYEVYLGEEMIGILEMTKNLEADDVFQTAITKQEQYLETKIQVSQELVFKPIHAAKKKWMAMDYIISEIQKKMVYDVEAAVITVDGVEMAIVKNEKTAREIFDTIMETYVNKDATIVEKDIVNEETITTRFVGSEMIVSAEQTLDRLNVMQEVEQIYLVQSGDSLWKIANRAGIRLDTLLEYNPGITENSAIKAGQGLKMLVRKPLITVKTVEAIKTTTIIEAPFERKENPNEYKTYSRVITEGQAGESEVTTHIVKINGVETGREEFSKKTIKEPVTHVVEVGTSQIIQRR